LLIFAWRVFELVWSGILYDGMCGMCGG
jgi:hypothetical protein